MKKECSHEKVICEEEEYEDYMTGEMRYERTYYTVSTCEDVDTHRYKCTQCGKMFYYSKAASDFWEKGIKSDYLPGLM